MAALIGLALIATACSSAGKFDIPSPTTGTDTGPVTTTTSPATNPAAKASGTFSNEEGDQVEVTVSLGEPVVASQANSQMVSACASALTASGSSLSRSAAIPITVTVTVLSTERTTILVNMLSGMSTVEYKGAETVGIGAFDGKPMLWATTYTNTGPECTPGSTGDGGTWASTVFHNKAPGEKTTWQSYLVVPDVVTPNSLYLTNPHNPISGLLFDPSVALNATNGNGTALTFTPGSKGLVVCHGEPTTLGGGRTRVYLALNATGAESRGCTAAGS